MKATSWNDAVLAEHRTYLQSARAKAVFDAMVAAAIALPDYDCAPAWHGSFRDFRYVDRGGGEYPFAFIVNRHDLLFYVRKPGLKRVSGGLATLRTRFPEAAENPAGEWTVRIRAAEEVAVLSSLVFGSTPVAPRAIHYWWVNHKHKVRDEIEGSYLWSAKNNKNGAKNVSYENMTRALPGEVVFSYADGEVGAIGVVIERVRTAPSPAESRQAGEQWRTDAGGLLPVQFAALSQPLIPKNHMTELGPTLPARHSPIRVTGDGNQGAYLAEIPAAMAVVLQDLLGGQLQRITKAIAIETEDRLSDCALEEQIWQRTDLGPREKRQLINARLGQGIFRDNVERLEKCCRVTGVLDRRHLRASHIKPWKLADDQEKLDGFNGLLLSPHIDHLFDRGHISFSDDGGTLISRHLNPTVIRAWGLDKPPRASYRFRPEQCAYLAFHRQHIFEKVAGGRRS